MNNELLNEILIELFGTEVPGEATDDGFLIKLRYGQYDKEQYERLYKLFSKVNDNLDPETSNIICYYSEFLSKLVLYLNNSNSPDLSETSADLVGMWGK